MTAAGRIVAVFMTFGLVLILAGTAQAEQTVVREGREWQYGGSATKMNWQATIDYCTNLVEGGHDDWHLPAIEELKSIIYCSNGTQVTGGAYYNTTYSGAIHPWACRDGNSASYASPTIDPSFESYAAFFWSATPGTGDPNGAWGVDFGTGFVAGSGKVGLGYARCVRSGPPDSLTLSSPPAGATLTKGQNSTITWTSANITGSIQIDLYKGATLVKQLSTSAANTGSFPFTPATTLADGNDYRIKLTANSGNVTAWSGYFTIQDRSATIPDHFHFSTIASPQLPETDILIRLEAHSASHNVVLYNGQVDLASSLGDQWDISLTYVNMQNGVKDFPLQFLREGLFSVKASSQDATGESNKFWVTDAGGCQSNLAITATEVGKTFGLGGYKSQYTTVQAKRY